VQAVHGPSSHHTTGTLTDRREDDIAVLLLRRSGDGLTDLCGSASDSVSDSGAPLAVRPRVRRTLLSVAQDEPERIAEARRHLRALLHDWASAEQIDSAVLLLSELLTNVLVHTDADALLLAEVCGEKRERRLRVEVTDTGDDLPHKRRPGELASSGRGLMLIELIADAWGVDPRGEGKSIWFELYESDGAGSYEPDGTGAYGSDGAGPYG
jgi:anti-sigma regulatory factor (Ser/Thr protein kinase)